MRPALTCIGLAVVALLATTTVAAAATYSGRGTDDARMRVSFEREQGKVKRFRIERVRFLCRSGERFRADLRLGAMSLDPHHRFQGRFTDSAGKVSVRVWGRVPGRFARGSLRSVAYDNGTKCATRISDWRARKRAAV